MSSTYAGNSANNPASITLPSDGDGPIKAADVNPALSGLLDLIRRIGSVMFPGSLKITEFTSSGTFNVPANVSKVIVVGCGGGAGGGSGAGNGTVINEWWCAGGGGGSANLGTVPCTVTPGGTVTVTIGAGGAPGADGGDTTFGALATFAGAKAGTSSLNANARKATSSTMRMCAEGGLGNRNQVSYMNLSTAGTNAGFSIWDSSALPAGITALHLGTQQAGQGGRGGVSNLLTTAEPGAANAVGGYAGGARGSIGTDSGSSGTFDRKWQESFMPTYFCILRKLRESAKRHL